MSLGLPCLKIPHLRVFIPSIQFPNLLEFQTAKNLIPNLCELCCLASGLLDLQEFKLPRIKSLTFMDFFAYLACHDFISPSI